ncbi:MAG: hypothetical protein HY014_11990 [Acidobacteria bacterium]|nr:hypothetical protein [Acidobacteriota bacterium]MBI3488876.1 hypothetical protein [Acidobacteriota bacterium]
MAQHIHGRSPNQAITDIHQVIHRRAQLRIKKRLKEINKSQIIQPINIHFNINNPGNSLIAPHLMAAPTEDQIEDDSDEDDTGDESGGAGGSGETSSSGTGAQGAPGDGNQDLDPLVTTGDPTVDAQIDNEVDAALADSLFDQTQEGARKEVLNQNKVELTWYGCKIYVDSRGSMGLVNNLGLVSILTGIAPEPVLTKIWSGEAGSWAYLVAQANRDSNGVVIYCIISPVTGWLYPQFIRPQ